MPDPGFLRATVPHLADPAVGMVQARWGHLNRRSSLLTRVQALLLDGHFLVEQAARHAAGRFFNFNGTAGVWRRRCIEEAGGWQHDTLTEDLDLSYRAQLAGWRFVFLPRVVAPAELPGSMTAFRGQQERWTKGSVQTARKLLPRLLAAPLPWPVRAEAAVHFTANFAHLLMVLLAILFFPASLLRASGGGAAPIAADLAVLLFSTFAFWIFYAAAGAAEGRGALRALATMPALMAVGVGLSVNGARAVLQGLRGPVGTFDRTPKQGSVDGDAGGPRAKTEAAKAGQTSGREPEPLSPPAPVPAPAGGAIPLPWIEGALALYLTVCLALALRSGLWSFLPFLVLFWAGFGSMAGAMLLEALRSRGAPAAG